MKEVQAGMLKPERYQALDVLRGITIAFMCIVNNPGSWSKVFAPLRHAAWDGCTPTDLVYPFFLFCAGVSMAFSFAKFNSLDKSALLKIFKRGIGLFLVGLALNMFPFFPVKPHFPNGTFGENWVWWIGHVRIFGVLQRIAIAYMIAAVIALWLRKPSKIMIAIGVLCTVYTSILLIFSSEPGALTLEGNVLSKVDMAIVGDNHMYHGYRYADGTRAAFDPEGLLGGLTAACTALLGYLMGCLIRKSRLSASYPDMVNSIFVAGLSCLAFAEVLSIFIPINKPMWSASYVFYAGGWSMVALGFLSYVIDIKGKLNWFKPFTIMGKNALMAFVFSGLIAKTLSMIGFSASAYFGANELMSLLWALIFASFIFLLQWILYRKNIIIRL